MNLVMEMEGERKKRKLSPEEQEEDEDVKMEKFFALIRSAKHIRDQLIDDGSSTPESNRKPPPAAAATAEQEKSQSNSNGKTGFRQPCLQPKDFPAKNLVANQVTAGTSMKLDADNRRADRNNRNNNNNEKHNQAGRRSRIPIDLNLFPIS